MRVETLCFFFLFLHRQFCVVETFWGMVRNRSLLYFILKDELSVSYMQHYMRKNTKMNFMKIIVDFSKWPELKCHTMFLVIQ